MNDMTTGVMGRLESYFERLGEVLGNEERRASFATYATGILSDAERKSVEPLAARACADPESASPDSLRVACRSFEHDL